MELSQNIHDSILKYLKKCDKNPILECEAKLDLDRTLGTSLTQVQFQEVFKYLCRSKKSFEKLVDDVSLDVTIDITNKKIRYTVPGYELIHSFCRHETIPHDKVSSMEKKKEDSQFTDYYFRINLKREEPLSEKDHEQIWNDNQSRGEFFRYKTRSSFMSKDSPYRVDLTIVKSGPTWKLLNEVKYEIEIEYLRDPSTPASTEHVTKICKLMYGILRISLDMVPILKESAHNNIVGQYLSLLGVKQQDINTKMADIKKNPKKNFLSYQPVTLDRSHINKDDEIKSNSVFSDYCVTDKADGERHLMFIDSKGEIYYINDRFKITKTSIVSENYKNTLIDGELITKDKWNNNLNVFMAFDLYFNKGTDQRSKPFISTDNNDDTRYNQVKSIVDDINSTKIKTKTFYTADSKNNILQTAFEKIWTRRIGNEYEYRIDGLIFQPMSLRVGAVSTDDKVNYNILSQTWWKVYKWKPPEENTIDMLTKFDKISLKQQYAICELYVYNNGTPSPLSILENGKYAKINDQGFESLFAKISLPVKDMGIFTEENPPRNISNNDIVEYRFDNDEKTWKPYRIRDDKTQQYKRTQSIAGTANALTTAKSIMQTIECPIDENMLSGKSEVKDSDLPCGDDDIYYARKVNRKQLYSRPMVDFHNNVIKRKLLIENFGGQRKSLFDIGCGKGGDIMKFNDAKYKFVLGVDNSEDNIIGAQNSAWARYFDNISDRRKSRNGFTPMVFLQMDATQRWTTNYIDSIKNNDLKTITKAFWGDKSTTVPHAFQKLKRHIGRVHEGFDVVNCQFALHYFFRDEKSINNFCENLKQVLKPGGHFIGTCFDGDRVHESFANGEKVLQFKHNERVIWQIKKRYDDEDSKIGRKIDVYIDSINKETTEYLVHFDELKKKLGEYGIRPLKEAEFKEFNLTDSHGSFESVFMDDDMTDKRTKDALNDKTGLKMYSFLNNWFVFKKV